MLCSSVALHCFDCWVAILEERVECRCVALHCVSWANTLANAVGLWCVFVFFVGIGEEGFY